MIVYVCYTRCDYEGSSDPEFVTRSLRDAKKFLEERPYGDEIMIDAWRLGPVFSRLVRYYEFNKRDKTWKVTKVERKKAAT